MLGQDMSAWLLAAGIAILTWVLLRRAHRARNKKPASSFSESHTHLGEGSSVSGSMPREITRWQVEMYDFARDMRAEMDTKMRALQTLVRQAEQQSQRLESAIDKAQRLGIAECRDTLEEIKRVTSQPLLDTGTLPPVERASHFQNEQYHHQVFALADSGLSAASIADQTDSTVGEVEMALNLRGSVP